MEPLRLETEELLERYASGERNFAGIRLQKKLSNSWTSTNVEDADLTGINLSGADLNTTGFKNVVLKNATLWGTFLVGSVFELVDFDDADLCGANLKRVQLRSCSMNGANLSYADLSFATFENVELDCALLEECILVKTSLSKVGIQNGKPCTLRKLRAESALIWDTTLPNGKRVTEPIIYDSFWDRETLS
jgi:uncharacterized protein YjbI with pentapeptide repeats